VSNKKGEGGKGRQLRTAVLAESGGGEPKREKKESAECWGGNKPFVRQGNPKNPRREGTEKEEEEIHAFDQRKRTWSFVRRKTRRTERGGRRSRVGVSAGAH